MIYETKERKKNLRKTEKQIYFDYQKKAKSKTEQKTPLRGSM